MTLAMFDAVNVSNLPLDAEAAAGYVNGWFRTWPLIQRMFPSAHLLSIAVTADADAECLDVEKLDATPAQAPGWVKRQQARGIHRPVVYCSVSLAMTVLGQLGKAGIHRPHVRLWTAHYTGQPHICGPGTCGYQGLAVDADGTQWTDRAFGLDLDQSLLTSEFFGPPPGSGDYSEDNDMHAAISPGVPVVVTRWAGAAQQNLPPFFTVETFDLVGDTGAQVKVAFQADGKTLETQNFLLTAGEHVIVTPAAGTKTLRFSRADSNAALAVALDVFRK